MTPLPFDKHWDDIASDLGYVGAPEIGDNGMPLCAEYDVNAYIAFKVNGVIHSLACRAGNSRYILSELVKVGDKGYSAIAYRNTNEANDRYFLCNVSNYVAKTHTYNIDYSVPYSELPEVSILKVATYPIDILQFIPENV